MTNLNHSYLHNPKQSSTLVNEPKANRKLFSNSITPIRPPYTHESANTVYKTPNQQYKDTRNPNHFESPGLSALDKNYTMSK